MPKARVSLQIKEALNIRTSQNRNADLALLSQQFQRLKTKLRQLIEALRAQHLSLLRMNETRLLVAKKVAALAVQSPISDLSGIEPDQGHTPDASNLSSYMAVHQALSERQRMYADRYLKFVVDYAIQWEKVIIARVSSSLQKAEELRRNLDHYQSKVEQLRLECNKVLGKGKNVDSKLSGKLQRNEEKLSDARNEYQLFTRNLSALMEEVALRCWKDLHPILLKLAQFDVTLAADENKILASLSQIAESLKQVAYQHGLKPEARLQEIETLSADMFTNKGEIQQPALEEDMNLLSLTMGTSNHSLSNVPNGNHTALTVRPLEQEAPNPTTSDTNPTTSEMLSIAAKSAPPPTMEMLNQSFADTSSVNGYDSSPHTSFTSPPTPPPQQQPKPRNRIFRSISAPRQRNARSNSGRNPFGDQPTNSNSFGNPQPMGTTPTNSFGYPPPAPPTTNPFGSQPIMGSTNSFGSQPIMGSTNSFASQSTNQFGNQQMNGGATMNSNQPSNPFGNAPLNGNSSINPPASTYGYANTSTKSFGSQSTNPFG